MFSLLIVLWRFLSDITTTTIGRFGESPVLTGKSSINNSVWIMRLLKALYRTVGILLDKLVCIAEVCSDLLADMKKSYSHCACSCPLCT